MITENTDIASANNSFNDELQKLQAYLFIKLGNIHAKLNITCIHYENI